MKRKSVLAAILALAFVGALVYFNGGGQVPSGQAPLQSLTPQNLTEIKNSFNAATDDVRVLLLLSPT
ncbi:MAG TPA: hypothetical protein VMT32_16710 [Bryobacteraceae bacterium]|nr:hypothetical protein [Bryobacteraceae bacterium]